MIEIRPIVHSEADRFLRLLCEVFSLDHERASQVFFQEPLFDLKRKWALFDAGHMRSILTTTALEFGWGRAVGIAGVATEQRYQGRGLASQLLREVLRRSEEAGEGTALLFAHRPEIYERVGFRVADRVVRGMLAHDQTAGLGPELAYADVPARYDPWSAADPRRLRRDEPRWNYWRWGYRVCETVGEGYVAFEGTTVREAVLEPGLTRWPVPPGTEWVGLRSVTEAIGVPLLDCREELSMLGWNLRHEAHLFMTDQF